MTPRGRLGGTMVAPHHFWPAYIQSCSLARVRVSERAARGGRHRGRCGRIRTEQESSARESCPFTPHLWRQAARPLHSAQWRTSDSATVIQWHWQSGRGGISRNARSRVKRLKSTRILIMHEACMCPRACGGGRSARATEITVNQFNVTFTQIHSHDRRRSDSFFAVCVRSSRLHQRC
jgi:hypothetical protein